MRLFAQWFGGNSSSQGGEADACFQRYLPMLRRRCRRLLRDDALVDDALQEIFVAIDRNIGQFRGGPEQRLPWLYRITTTHCLRLLEREKRWFRCIDESWDPEEPMTAALAEGIVSSGIDDAELRAIVAQLLSRLPEREREALVLRYVSGLTQDEIADVMGTSRNQVRRWLTSATDKGRRMLSEP